MRDEKMHTKTHANHEARKNGRKARHVRSPICHDKEKLDKKRAMTKANTFTAEGKKRYIYTCRLCGKWHLTKQPPRLPRK